jgi:adenylosuccinate synthase
MTKAYIVIGSGYGDEGKGKIIDYLASKLNNSIVVRYNGGAQAGHTVVHGEKKHVFSHFGSGALANKPTYLSKDFIVNPIKFNEEYRILKNMGIIHQTYINKDCRVTTILDMVLNQVLENNRNNRHGSCGLGIYETIKRHEVIPLSLLEIRFDNIKDKLAKIYDYCIERLNQFDKENKTETVLEFEMNFKTFNLDFVEKLLKLEVNEMTLNSLATYIIDDEKFLLFHDSVIFEGAQGLLLSEKYGTMPHCTPSDPGCSIPVSICFDNNISISEVIYVTRCYQTRHGSGSLKNEQSKESLGISFDDETNVSNQYQGNFRYAPLDIDSLEWAICDDFKNVGHVTDTKKYLAVTCVDQLTENDTEWVDIAKNIASELGVKLKYMSYGQKRNDNIVLMDIL